MTSSIPLLLSGIALGFGYAALPGVVNAEVLRRGLAGGFRPAFVVHAGAVFGAGFWAIVALSGASWLQRYAWAAIALGVIGCCFLAWLAWTALRDARTGGQVRIVTVSSRNGFTTGLVAGIANPAGLPFWTGVAGGVMTGNGDETARAAILVAGVLAGSLLWGVLVASVIGRGRQALNAQLLRWIYLACAAALGFFALRLAWQTLRLVADEM
jgi:threonine/homoserine/homoserine lactone efflux protein